jgi:tetraacyldisaccharide 4'-kinase
LLRAKKLPKFSISVGNLSFGGTGKTPFTIKLAEELIARGFNPCVLMRGYKSKKKDSTLILDSSCLDLKPDVQDTGDEALEIFEHFRQKNKKLIIAINPNRLTAAMSALEVFKDIDVFILDDGHQHLAINPDLKILLKNIHESGFSREFDFNEKNADFIIHTKVHKDWLRANPEKFALEYNLSLTNNLHNIEELGIFTGIGDPRSFQSMIETYLKCQKFNLEKIKIRQWFFPDHHKFSQNEVTQVLTLGINIITTNKDLTKIPQELQGGFDVANIEIVPYPENLFEKLIKVVVKTDVSGLVVGLTSPTKGEKKDA